MHKIEKFKIYIRQKIANIDCTIISQQIGIHSRIPKRKVIIISIEQRMKTLEDFVVNRETQNEYENRFIEFYQRSLFCMKFRILITECFHVIPETSFTSLRR